MKRSNMPLIILSVILLLLANLGLWLSRTIYNPQIFSNLATSAFQESEVRNAISAQIVDNTLESKPLVRQAIGGSIESAISGMLGAEASQKILQKTATRFQGYLTTDNRQDVVIEVGRVSSFIKAAATTFSEDLGDQIPEVTPRTITFIKSDSLPDVNKWLKPIMMIGPIAGVIAIVIMGYAYYVNADKQRFLKTASIYYIIGIVLFGLLIPYFRAILQSNINDQNAAIVATSVYNSFAEVLLMQLAVLLGVFIAIYLIGLVWSKGWLLQIRQSLIKRKGDG